jgi:nucleotide-binding universal stress UspA family protein
MKRILICLSLEPFDKHIISYVSNVPQLFDGAQLHLVHVLKDTANNFPTSEIEESLDLNNDGFDADDLRQHAIKVGLKGAETSIAAVLKGSPSSEILRYMHAWDIDLAFLGKRDHDHGAGYLASQLASRSPASLWLVPETDKKSLNRVLLATDFSDASGVAYDCTSKLKSQLPQFHELHVISAYNVPAGYFKSGLTYDQMSDKMRAITEKGLSDWIVSMPQIEGVQLKTMVEEEDTGTAAAILTVAAQIDADLVVLGSRGRSGLAAFLLGSTTDRIIRSGHKYPVFVARSHDEQSKKLLRDLFRVE